jgi:hypothetical protein
VRGLYFGFASVVASGGSWLRAHSPKSGLTPSTINRWVGGYWMGCSKAVLRGWMMVGSWRAFVRFGFIAAQNRRWLWVGFPIVFGPSQGLLTNRSTGR